LNCDAWLASALHFCHASQHAPGKDLKAHRVFFQKFSDLCDYSLTPLWGFDGPSSMLERANPQFVHQLLHSFVSQVASDTALSASLVKLNSYQQALWCVGSYLRKVYFPTT
jgi:hypothetical protein